MLQESNFLINGRSYILWFNYGVSARISTKTGANQTILQIIEIGYFLEIFSLHQIEMLPRLISIQYFSYTNINGIYGRNLKLDYFLPVSTKLKKVEFDIYLNIKPKLSEQSLPHQCSGVSQEQNL